MTHSNDIFLRSFLRPESVPLEWERLAGSQKLAIKQLVEFLNEAVLSLDKELENPRPRSHTFYHPAHINRTCALNGVRGSGKTSVLKTLFELTKSEGNFLSGLKRFAKLHQNDITTKEVELYLESLKNRLVWLDPIDMEVLPGPSNLLACILSRIEEVVDPGIVRGKERLVEPGILTPAPRSDQALMRLRMLMQDVTLAWDGNMPERGQHIDPDTFASEVIRAERARVRIPDRVSTVLAELSSSSKPPLYLLPVDDFDMSPTRCLELLRLIRMLNVPELFTIVLGDMKTTEDVLHIKLTGEFAKLADIQLHADFEEGPFHQARQKTASDALRKLIPPNQRIMLSNLTKHEALSYRPTLKDIPLGELLSKIRIEHFGKWFGESVDSGLELGCLLFGKRQPSEKWLTTSAAILTRPPRVIADLWQELRDVLPVSDGQLSVRDMVPVLVNLLENEAESLSDKRRDQLRRLFDQRLTSQGTTCTPVWVCSTGELRIGLIDQSVERIATITRSPEVKSSIVIKDGGDWRLETETIIEETDKNTTRVDFKFLELKAPGLDNRLVPWLTLVHDLLNLDKAYSDKKEEPRNTYSQSLVPDSDQIATISTEWRREVPRVEVMIPWPAPQFYTFIETDCFLEDWRSRSKSSRGGVEPLDKFATSWLAFVFRFLSPKSEMVAAKSDEEYLEDRFSYTSDEMLNKLLCLFAPEYGVSLSGLVRKFPTIEYLNRNSETIQKERLRRIEPLVRGLIDSPKIEIFQEILSFSLTTILKEKLRSELKAEITIANQFEVHWKNINIRVSNEGFLDSRRRVVNIYRPKSERCTELLNAYLYIAPLRNRYIADATMSAYSINENENKIESTDKENAKEKLRNEIAKIVDLPFTDDFERILNSCIPVWAKRSVERKKNGNETVNEERSNVSKGKQKSAARVAVEKPTSGRKSK